MNYLNEKARLLNAVQDKCTPLFRKQCKQDRKRLNVTVLRERTAIALSRWPNEEVLVKASEGICLC